MRAIFAIIICIGILGLNLNTHACADSCAHHKEAQANNADHSCCDEIDQQQTTHDHQDAVCSPIECSKKFELKIVVLKESSCFSPHLKFPVLAYSTFQVFHGLHPNLINAQCQDSPIRVHKVPLYLAFQKILIPFLA